MTDMELAVRCLHIEEEVAPLEHEIRELHARVIERIDDDDTARLARIAQLHARVEVLRAEQAECSDRMKSVPDLADAVIAHAEAGLA